MKNKIDDVRDHLVAMLELLGDDTRSADEMAQAIERANATASIAGTYFAAVRVEIDAIRVLDETGRLPTAMAGVQQVVALDGRPAGPVPMRMIAGGGR